jgi:AAA family ATP:ADP antiporter
MGHKIIRALWGDLRGEELKKFSLLALGFFFLIGSWWPLKTLKDSIFINMVGPLHLPEAKILSVLLFFPLVLLYSKLVDHFSKEKLLYIFITTYGCIGLGLVYLLAHPTFGLANPIVGPSRWLGWAFYVFAESYISLHLALYWSFINDITTPESAQKGYGFIIFATQLGGLLFTILGNYLSSDTTLYIQRAPLIALISVLMFFMIGIVVLILHYVVGAENLKGYHAGPSTETAAEKIGFFNGLRLVLTRPYVAGIFIIMFFQEVVSTLMGFQLSWLAKGTYPDPGQLNKFLFDFALAVQVIACLFALVGTSFFQRRFGMNFALIAYPLCIGSAVVCYLFHPTLQTIFYVMLIAKALGFALNQPSKEMLYIPTSKNIKYKSKAWIDMFGQRLAKASGMFANRFIGPFVALTSTLTIGLIVVWALLASVMGKSFKRAVQNKELIE